MGEPAKRRATYEDLRNAPRHLVAELIHGKLVTHPVRPARIPSPSRSSAPNSAAHFIAAKGEGREDG